MKHILVLAMLVGSSVSVWAQETRLATPDGQILSVRGESGQWVVEAFGRADDGWQEQLWRKSFPTEALAQTFIQKNLPHSANFERGVNRSLAPLQNQTLPPIWEAKNHWTWEWEQRFAEWVLANVEPKFFQRYNVATDCADVAYAMRWIFARINGLPAANHLGGAGEIFSHQSMRPQWLALSTAENWWEDKRFLAALNYLLNNSYTHTLMVDSYPIEISQAGFFAGAYHLSLHGTNGHTQFVHRTYFQSPYDVPFKIIASTVPRTVRSLFESYFWSPTPAEPNRSGFMRMRWAVAGDAGVTLTPSKKMPFYSTMQFQPDFMKDQKSFSLRKPKAAITSAGARDQRAPILWFGSSEGNWWLNAYFTVFKV